ncbi:MAG: glycoside hydrolase family 127 protein, partial [Acidobacteriota bacterium]
DLGSDQDEWNGPAPSLVAEDVLERIQRVDNEPLTFQTADLIRPADLELKPLYQLHDRRYAVYWDRFTPGEWDDYQAEFRAAQARLKEEEAQALDIIRLGDSESELNHNLQSEISWPSTYRGRNCRDARSGGFFSFEANVAGGEPTRLFATFWGGERNRAFEILVDGTKIAYQELDNERPGDFIELSYDIPESLTKGKSKVTIRFEPLQDRTAGPVFGCRVSRR